MLLRMITPLYPIDYTLYVLVSSGVGRGKLTFQETAQEAFGRRGSIIVSVVQFLAPFSGVCYTVCGSDFLWETRKWQLTI